MQHAKPRPGETRYGKLNKKQMNILSEIQDKDRKWRKRMTEVGRRHDYVRHCVDHRTCPECGGKLIYTDNHQWFNWIIPGCGKKSNCICNVCGYMYEYGHSSGLGPGRPC